MYTGPNITTTGLVYGYDTGIGTSTNDVATRLYPGDPTTNAVTNASTFGGGSWVSYGNGNDGTFITEFGTTGYQIINRGSWNGIYQNFNLGSSGNYTFSAWFRYLGGSANNNGATVYVSNYGGPDVAATINKSLVGVWQRISYTVNVTSPGNVYFYIISYGGTYGADNSSWQVTMPQIESGTIRTPFVNGTRSSTQALIDAKRATTIDLSTVSFNSSAQPTFDGTDDYINFTAPGLGGTATVEMIARIGSGYTGKMLFGWLYYDVWCWDGNMGYNTANGDLYGISSSTVSSLGIVGNYRHFVFEMRSDASYTNNKIYVNTVNQSLSQIRNSENSGTRNFNSGNGRISSWRGDLNYVMPMDCPVFRVYNRALTQTEIDQNFLGYRRRFGI